MPARYAYLGPPGTFTEAALRQVVGPDQGVYLPQLDVTAAIEAVRDATADYAVVAIENSVEGGVTAVLDALATGPALVILREMLVPVSFTLAGAPSQRLAEVHRIAAHPHAWAQCRGWLHRHLPRAVHVPASSNTASAAALGAALAAAAGRCAGPAGGADDARARAGTVGELGFDAALVPPTAVEHYGLAALAQGVADKADAVTRFVLIGPQGETPPPTGVDKTTLQVHLPAERAGALLEMLEHFATRGINLTRIESRPSGVALGRYSFSIDAEGHVADARMAEAMVGLHRFSPLVRYLGSYPMAGLRPSPLKEGTADADFAAAQAWVAAVQRGELV